MVLIILACVALCVTWGILEIGAVTDKYPVKMICLLVALLAFVASIGLVIGAFVQQEGQVTTALIVGSIIYALISGGLFVRISPES